ncbi:heavy metal translocating P-type ATPase [Mesomycoplasma dispar]|uniref:Heavy metal translocating P-type ATPase n=2 Tax=Mesomycoplasma dispar TaxID=86660 RepID=A0ABM6PRN5_9BACT|nr:heavy metal translocating P-type ATPase [Mesomycoplasma dispar]
MKKSTNNRKFFADSKQKAKIKIFIELLIFIFAFFSFIFDTLNNYKVLNFSHDHKIHLILASILFFLAFLVIFLEKKYFLAYKNLLRKIFTMELLIAIASHVSFIYSAISFLYKIITGEKISMEFFEVSIILFLFFNAGKYLEEKLQKKSSSDFQGILKLKNRYSYIIVDGKKEQILTNKITPGNIVFVPKGEVIPTDSTLNSDFATIDYSSINGESLPIEFVKNQEILSGSINIGEPIYLTCTKKAQDSFLMQTINRLESIFETPSKIERVSTKIVSLFTPTVLILSILAFAIWVIIGYSLGDFEKIYTGFTPPRNSHPFYVGAHIGVAVLVISCPCAFGIAAPMAIYSSSILASKNRILFANSEIYEKIITTKTIIFDKTGTLTEGKPKVVEFQGDSSFWPLIKEMAQHSKHPISLSIYNFLPEHQEKFDNFKVNEIPGQGLEHIDLDSNKYSLISHEFAKNNNFWLDNNFKFDKLGNYTVFAKNNKVIAVFLIIDQVKESAKKVVKKFQSQRINCIIASGDNPKNVENVAKILGIKQFYANLKPNDKFELVEKLKKETPIIFVGDGLNDILALKSADLSIAFESGSNLSNSIADISLFETDLVMVYKSIEIIKKTNKLVKLNFLWAILFNSLFIPLAFLGFINPVFSMSLMLFSSIFLIVNTIIFKKRHQKFLEKAI